MKKVLLLLLLGGAAAGAFLLWRRSQQPSVASDDLWAPIETWPAQAADRWPSSPDADADVSAGPSVPAVVPPAADPAAAAPKRPVRRKAES